MDTKQILLVFRTENLIFFGVKRLKTDIKLQLTVADMETLKQQLPDLALSVSTPDLNSITQFFLSKSLSEVSSMSKDKDKSSMMITKSKTNELKEKRNLHGDR